MTSVIRRATNMWQARTCYAAAALFTLASGGTNLIYGWSKGTDTGSSLVWAAVSIGVSIIFALSWPALIISLDRKQWARAAMVFVALIITGTYSVSAALGSAMGGRANAAVEESTLHDQRRKAQTAYDIAKAERDSLKPSRPVAEIEAIVAGAKPQCRIIVQSGSRETICTKPPALTAELGRAKRRDELETKIESTTAELKAASPARVANSDAVALASYLSALGIETTPDRINKLLVLLAVLVIECGGGLALTVGMALSDGVARSGHTDREIIQGERSGANHRTEHPNAGTERPVRNASAVNGFRLPHTPSERPERSAHERVLSALRLKDGVLFGSQVRMGALFGWSKTRMNEVLHELEAAGRVRLSISRKGTAVTLPIVL